MVDCGSAPAASVGVEDAFVGAAGEAFVAAAGPATPAAGLTFSCVDTTAAFTFDPPVATDDGAFAFAATALVGAAAVAALATRAATNFAAAAFVCAAFSAAALRTSAALAFADAAFLSATDTLAEDGVAETGLAEAGLAETALSTGLEACLEAGLGGDLEADDLAFAWATTIFAAGFSAVLPVRAVLLLVFLATVLAVDLPRAAAVAEAVRAAALLLVDFADAAFAALPERAVERVALWLAALAAALTVRTGVCVTFPLPVVALPAVALLDERAVVRLTAACFAAFACSGVAPRLADLALFLALFVDMRSTLLIASAARAAGAEPKGQGAGPTKGRQRHNGDIEVDACPTDQAKACGLRTMTKS